MEIGVVVGPGVGRRGQHEVEVAIRQMGKLAGIAEAESPACGVPAGVFCASAISDRANSSARPAKKCDGTPRPMRWPGSPSLGTSFWRMNFTKIDEKQARKA